METTKFGKTSICILALFAVLFSLVSLALCAPRDCMPPKPAESTGDCQGMPMGNETGKTAPSSPMHCCGVSQYPIPATQTPIATTVDRQMVAVVVFDITVPLTDGSENLISEPIASSPPTDLQSLFCTLLI